MSYGIEHLHGIEHRLTRSCPTCGKGVRSEARFCPACGAVLNISAPAGKIGAASLSANLGAATSHRTSICPNCQKTIHSAMRFCRSCGHSLQGIFCPLCSRANRPNVKFCAHCGAVMGAEAAGAEAAGAEAAGAPPPGFLPPDGVLPPDANPYETGKLPPGIILAGRYMLLHKIAQGGMGAVYEAKEVPTSTGPRLAIKEMSLSILSRLSADQQQKLVDSFHREFELLSRLSHPNLVRAYQFFEEQSRYFFVMEYIEGRTLENVLDSLPPGQLLPVERVLAWAKQLCAVLHYLHTHQPPIIYRDLKPSNVMELYPRLPGGQIDASASAVSAAAVSAAAAALSTGRVSIKLFDFGIARFYKPGQKSDTVRFGTEGYLAPEIVAYQVQTSELTDVYALGALLHQALTRFDPQMDPWKRPPIRSLNPNVPEHIVKAIEHALALNPAHRTPDAAGLLKEMFGPDARPEDLAGAPIEAGAAATPAFRPAPLAPPGIPGRYKTPLTPPAAQPPPSSPPEAHTDPAPAGAVQLDLGSVPKGKTAVGSFEVILAGDHRRYRTPITPAIQPAVGLQGQVTSSTPWLKVQPERFPIQPAGGKVTINVKAQTSRLPLGRWETRRPAGFTDGANNRTPLWFLGLPRLLRGWLAAHLNWFAPLPARHQAMLQVHIPANPGTVQNTDMQIQTLVEIFPPAWRSFIGWALVFGLIGLEASLIFILIFLAITFALTALAV